MTSLSDHQSNSIVKLILIGESGTGKTSALASLVVAGYKLFILDFDNLLAPLKNRLTAKAPDKIGNVFYKTFRDKMTATIGGPVVDGTPKAFHDAMQALNNWKEGDKSLGPAEKFGPDCVVVIDSLTRGSDAAMNWGEFITPAGKGGEKDGRAIYGEAQRAIEALLSLLTSEAFATNVIVIAHIAYQMRGVTELKGFPKGPGQALGPMIPTYFPTMLQVENTPNGRVVRTVPTAMIDLKNPVMEPLPAAMPIETALADFFKAVKTAPAAPQPARSP